MLYIGPGTEVYEGMVVGNTAKGVEMRVNPTKGKHLTNVRSAGNDDAIDLVPPEFLTVEKALELVGDDEYIEVTPKNIRLRKQLLTKLDVSRARNQQIANNE